MATKVEIIHEGPIKNNYGDLADKDLDYLKPDQLPMQVTIDERIHHQYVMILAPSPWKGKLGTGIGYVEFAHTRPIVPPEPPNGGDEISTLEINWTKHTVALSPK